MAVMRRFGAAVLAIVFGGMAGILTAAAAPVAAVTSVDDTVATVAASARGDVYLLRGFGDVFSRGLDAMAATLNSKGIDAEVTNHDAWRRIAQEIIDKQRRMGPRPVVLVGHSLGANAVVEIAEMLKKRHITVQYMVTLAATGPDPVPSNVRRVDNFYFATNGWGEPVKGAADFSGSLTNHDFSNVDGVGHFNIDKQPAIQREILARIISAVH